MNLIVERLYQHKKLYKLQILNAINYLVGIVIILRLKDSLISQRIKRILYQDKRISYCIYQSLIRERASFQERKWLLEIIKLFTSVSTIAANNMDILMDYALVCMQWMSMTNELKTRKITTIARINLSHKCHRILLY